jgi:hypothetical protein
LAALSPREAFKIDILTSQRVKIAATIALSVLMLATFHACAKPAKPATEPTPTVTIATAKDLNDLAQSYYYDAQRRNIEQQSTSVVPWLTGVASIAVAFVALFSFLGNYRTSIVTQRDTQYTDAAKQFGDKDSAALRAVGAALIGAKGAEPRYRIETMLRLFDQSRQEYYPYYDIAITQLATGFLIEEDPEVLNAMFLAFQRLISVGSGWYYKYKGYPRIEERLCDSLRRCEMANVKILAAALSTPASDEQSVIDSATEASEVWDRAETAATLLAQAANVDPINGKTKLAELLWAAERAVFAQSDAPISEEQKMRARLSYDRLTFLCRLLIKAKERADLLTPG